MGEVRSFRFTPSALYLPNVSGFDTHFLVRYLAEKKRIPELIMRGLKILSMECMGVRVIDSYSFLPQSLASLPRTFNEPELCKGEYLTNE